MEQGETDQIQHLVAGKFEEKVTDLTWRLRDSTSRVALLTWDEKLVDEIEKMGRQVTSGLLLTLTNGEAHRSQIDIKASSQDIRDVTKAMRKELQV